MTDEEIVNWEIYQAIRKGDFEEANLLIDFYHIQTGLVSWGENESPLHAAAWQNASDIIRKLLRDGADINLQTNIYQTPLMLAIIAEADDAFAVLLELGADPNIPPRDKYGGPTTPLMEVARRRNHRNLQMLLEAGARPEHKDWDGDTALDYALHAHDEKAAEIIRKNVNPA